MKIQCNLCKEIADIGPFRMDAEGIHVTCGVCGDEFFVPSGRDPADPQASPAPTPADIDGPAMTCPKCDLVQAQADACRACGLRADRFDDFTAPEGEHDDALAAMFAACEAEWGDRDAHERFAAAVAENASFAYGAKRYRRALRERPGDPTAKRQLQRLARMAEAELLSAAAARASEEDVKEPYKAVVVLIIIMVLVLGIGGYYLMTLKSRRDRAEQAVPPGNESPVLRDDRRRPTGPPAGPNRSQRRPARSVEK